MESLFSEFLNLCEEGDLKNLHDESIMEIKGIKIVN
jgi:hypothetical protein